MIEFCATCNKEYETKSRGTSECPECRKKTVEARKELRIEKEGYMPTKRKRSPLVEDNEKAKKSGLSYGQWQARRYMMAGAK